MSSMFIGPGAIATTRIVTGHVNNDGTIFGGTGFTVAHPETGGYVITFATPFASPPLVTITGIDIGSGISNPYISSAPSGAPGAGVATTGFGLRIASDTGSLHDAPFEFSAQPMA